MKYTLALIFLLLLHTGLFAQYIYVLRGDSVKFTKNDSCELIIENHTQMVPGFLYNKGRGRTEFRRAFVRISDSAYLLGSDTLTQSGYSYWVNSANNLYDVNLGPVGIHRNTPIAMLDLPGAVNVDDTASFLLSGTPVIRVDGYQSGGYKNLYFGPTTGTGNTGTACTFIGPMAGGDLTTGNNITMAGAYAGADNMGTPSGRNTFVGAFAVESNGGTDLTALGIEAADGNGGSSTLAIGNAATQYSAGKNNCVFIGDLTGTATNQATTTNSTYIGGMAGAVETGAKNNNTVIGGNARIINAPHVPPSLVSNSTALGYQAIVGTSNTMVFGDDSTEAWTFNSYGGAAPGQAAIIVGWDETSGSSAYLTSAGTWTNVSDRHKKENFTPLDETALLDRVDRLPITRWNYKGDPAKHIGPVAQAFYRTFGLGDDDKAISTLDPAGIALAAIQGISQRLNNATEVSAKQREALTALQQKIAAQQAELTRLLTKFNGQESELDRQEETLKALIDKTPQPGNDQH